MPSKKKMPKGVKVGIIGDTHLPYEHPDYLEFCVDTLKDKEKCDVFVHIGDLIDNNSISYHQHSPDMWNPAMEMEACDERLEGWFNEFPELYLCRGNHDKLVDRKAKTVGLPARCFRAYREIWNLPKGWIDGREHEIDGVIYEHGYGYGVNAHRMAAIQNRASTVMGHSHAFAGIAFLASHRDCIFGMNVGCGIHIKSEAFDYSKDTKNRPVLACATITEGENPQIFRMRL